MRLYGPFRASSSAGYAHFMEGAIFMVLGDEVVADPRHLGSDCGVCVRPTCRACGGQPDRRRHAVGFGSLRSTEQPEVSAESKTAFSADILIAEAHS